MPIRGEFRIENLTVSQPSLVTVKIIQKRDGRDVITREITAETERSGSEIRFAGDIVAPKKYGTFYLQARYAGKLVCEREFKVAAKH